MSTAVATQMKTTGNCDLREWLKDVKRLEQLEQISGAHWDLELGALTEIILERIATPPAVVFDNVPGFDPNRLEVEITETAILHDGDEVKSAIARLHALGVKIALDDFGVGYSSLSHLRMFPFDKLKIDQTFIADCTKGVASATLVHAVISVGRALGMKVVAEGVETEQQRQFLKIAGVHAMQGYLFGKPMPIAALREMMSPEAVRQRLRA